MAALPNIVLVHGAWAAGSCWSTVIERLQADGYKVTAPQLQRARLRMTSRGCSFGMSASGDRGSSKSSASTAKEVPPGTEVASKDCCKYETGAVRATA